MARIRRPSSMSAMPGLVARRFDGEDQPAAHPTGLIAGWPRDHQDRRPARRHRGRRRPAGPGPASKPTRPSPAPGAGQRDGDLVGGGERLGGLGEGARRNQRDGLEAGLLRVHGELADREPVAVGRGERDRVALDLDAGHRSASGSVSSRPAATATWATAAANAAPRDGARTIGHVRQRRVVVDRQRQQGEPGAAAGHHDLGAVGGHLDRLRRAGAGDVGEQPAGHERAARPRTSASTSTRPDTS